MADSTARYDRDIPVLWYPGVSLFETGSWLSPAGYLTRTALHCTANMARGHLDRAPLQTLHGLVHV